MPDYYDNYRDFGIQPKYTYNFMSMDYAVDCTNLTTYTPVYEGPDTMLILSYTFDPAATSNFIEDLTVYGDGFWNPDSQCSADSFSLVAMPSA